MLPPPDFRLLSDAELSDASVDGLSRNDIIEFVSGVIGLAVKIPSFASG